MKFYIIILFIANTTEPLPEAAQIVVRPVGTIRRYLSPEPLGHDDRQRLPDQTTGGLPDYLSNADVLRL